MAGVLPSNKIDVDALRRVVEDGDDDMDEKVVSRGFLRILLDQLDVPKFQSPIIDLTKVRAHG